MKIFISTTTFARYSNEPLKLLKDAGMKYGLNPFPEVLGSYPMLKKLKEILVKGDGFI